MRVALLRERTSVVDRPLQLTRLIARHWMSEDSVIRKVAALFLLCSLADYRYRHVMVHPRWLHLALIDAQRIDNGRQRQRLNYIAVAIDCGLLTARLL